jgi:hypothetical protein
MPSNVETLVNPNDLINPDSLTEILNFDYNQLLIDTTNAFNTNSSTFLTLKSNLNTNILNLFNTYTELSTDSSLLTDNLANIKDQLNTLKTNNTSLKEELNRIYDIGNDSNELINDYKQLYNINYTRNWGMFASIIFSCYLLSTIFKSRQITI